MFVVEKASVKTVGEEILITIKEIDGDIIRTNENVAGLFEIGVKWEDIKDDPEGLEFIVSLPSSETTSQDVSDILTNPTAKVLSANSPIEAVKNFYDEFVKYVEVKSVVNLDSQV